MKQLIYYLFAGTRGGEARAKIINVLRKKPINSNKLAKELKYDYKTIQHHVNILLKNKMLEKKGAYGGVLFISPLLDENIKIFEDIWEQFG